MRKIYLLLLTFLWFLVTNAQTTLINPAAEGGFESGTDFTSNGWTVVNGSTNKWFCGSVTTGSPNTTWFTGNRGAYISDDAAGATWNYNASTSNRSHFYRDVVFPAGETTITLEFSWRGNGNDGDWDNLQVYLIPITSTPTTASPTNTSTSPGWLSSGYFLLQRNGSAVPSGTTTVTYTFTTAQANYAAGNTRRLVFTWKNDGSFGEQPPAAIDNISLISSCTTPVAGLNASGLTTTGATLNWTTASGATGYQVRYKKVSDPASVTTWATPTATTNIALPITGLIPATEYEFQVAAVGVPCTLFTNSSNFTTLCNSESIPTTVQSFNNAVLPVCWSTSLISGTTNWAPDTDNDGVPSPKTGTRFMGKDYNASDALVVSQPINMTTAGANGARINVWIYRNTVNKANDRIRFHVNTTPDLTGATQLLEIFPLISESPSVSVAGWYNYTADIPASYNSEATVYIIAQGTTDGSFTSYGIGFDDFKVEPIPTCDAPTDITFSSITSNGAEVNWNPPSIGSPVNYQLYVSTSSTDPTGSTTPTVTGINAPHTLTGLSANTTYYIWIRSNCGAGGGIGLWSPSATFKTLCSSATTLNETFDAVTTPALPDCWSKFLRNTSGLPNVTTTSTNAYSSANAVDLYNSGSGSSADIMLVSPPLSNIGAGTYRLKFWAKTNDATQDIVVGTLDNLSASANFSTVQTVDINTTYAQYIVDFSSYSGTDIYIALKRLSTSTYTNVYIDNIVWEVIPTCDAPSALVISNIITTGADLDWSAPSIGSPVNYQVYVNTSNTAPTGSSTPTVTGVTNPVTLTGLVANTTYYVWVRSNCGGSDLSNWSSPVSFTTACNATSVPYSQNFESAIVPGLPSCTSGENPGTGNAWITSDAPGSGFTTKTLQYSYNSTNAADAWFYTQGLNLTAGTSYRLTFKYGNNSTTYVEKLEVKYGNTSSVGGMTDLIVDYPIISIGTQATSSTDFTPSTTGVYYIGFHAYSSADQWNLYVDDISVIVTPTCNEPTAVTVSNITTTTAQLDWAAPSAGSPVSYQVYYSTTNTTPTVSTTPSVSGVTGTTTNLTGLTAASTYYLWMRTFCGGTDYSAWTPVAVAFSTQCNAASIPTVVESFDNPTMPICWSTSLVTGTTDWAPDTDNDGVPASHTGAMFMGKDYTASDALVVSQPINMTTAGANGARINVWIYRNTVNKANDRIRFHINTSTGLSGATQLLEIFPLTSVAPTVSSAGWYNYTADIPASFNTEPLVYIIAEGTTDGTFTSYGIGFDDFKVEAIPNCNEPTNLIISNTTTAGAKLDWSVPSTGTPVSYQVFYNATNTAPTASTTPTLTGLTGTTTNLTGLAANTTYYVWMRTFCGGSDYSEWTATPITFITPCNSISLPYAQNFESAAAPNLPSCSSSENAGSGNDWIISSAPGSGFTSQTLQYSYNTTSPANAWFYTQGLNLTAGNMYTLTFRYGNNSISTYTEKLKVSFGTSPASTSMTNAIVDYPTVTGASAATSSTNFIAPTTEVYYIGFNAYSNADQWNLYVDDIAVTATTLPVTLSNFRGEKAGESNRLFWTTSTETNNKGFELQRSADGKNFTPLTFVNSKSSDGNSNTRLDYSFTDARPLGGNNYYRLKQVDKDGKSTYSDIVLLKSAIKEISISSLYPNPATEKLNLIITSPSAEKLQIVVTDLSGKLILQQSTNVAIGDTQLQLNIATLASGTYVVKAICANGCETAVHRFVKQ